MAAAVIVTSRSSGCHRDGPLPTQFDGPSATHSVATEITAMLLQIAIGCLIVFSVSILIAHAVDAFRDIA